MNFSSMFEFNVFAYIFAQNSKTMCPSIGLYQWYLNHGPHVNAITISHSYKF